MSFLSFRSLKGGRKLREWGLVTSRVKKPSLKELGVEDSPEPQLVGDTYSWHIGYCGGCNEKIYISRSIGAFLYGLFKREFK